MSTIKAGLWMGREKNMKFFITVFGGMLLQSVHIMQLGEAEMHDVNGSISHVP